MRRPGRLSAATSRSRERAPVGGWSVRVQDSPGPGRGGAVGRRRRASPDRRRRSRPRASSTAGGGAAAGPTTTSSIRVRADPRSPRGAPRRSRRPPASMPTSPAPPRSSWASLPGVARRARPAGPTGSDRRSGAAAQRLAGRRAVIVALAAPSEASSLWYLTRGTGTVALVLLTVVLVLGVLARAGGALPACPRFVTPALHRNLSLLAVVLIAFTSCPRWWTRTRRSAGRCGGAVRLGVPADLARPRSTHLRHPHRGDRHQPGTGPARPSGLARGALGGLCELAARGRARSRVGQLTCGPDGCSPSWPRAGAVAVTAVVGGARSASGRPLAVGGWRSAWPSWSRSR